MKKENSFMVENEPLIDGDKYKTSRNAYLYLSLKNDCLLSDGNHVNDYHLIEDNGNHVLKHGNHVF